jgi:VWFA-related protein
LACVIIRCVVSRTSFSRILTLSFVLLCSQPSTSQQVPLRLLPDPAQDPQMVYQDHLQVTEILLQVTVTDEKGEPVLGLSREDFLVEESQRPMEITGVSYHAYLGSGVPAEEPTSVGARPEVVPLAAPAPPAKRRFIFLFHDLIFLSDRATLGLMSQRMRAGRGIRRWLQDEMQPGDEVAVATYSSRLRLILDFSSDKSLIADAVDHVLARRAREVETPLDNGADASLARFLPSGNQLRDATTNIKRALQVLARAAGRTEGRKHLVFLTIGTDIAGSERGLLDKRFTPGFAESLNNHQVIVYPIDLTPPGVEHALVWNLVDLAEDTGGRYTAHVEDFHKPLRTISRSLTGFYEVAYHTAIPIETSGYRTLKVETRFPGHRVSAKRGYFFGLED